MYRPSPISAASRTLAMICAMVAVRAWRIQPAVAGEHDRGPQERNRSRERLVLATREGARQGVALTRCRQRAHREGEHESGSEVVPARHVGCQRDESHAPRMHLTEIVSIFGPLSIFVYKLP